MFELNFGGRATNARWVMKLFVALGLALALSGCSMFDRDATIVYNSSVYKQRLPGAERVSVLVTSEEGRTLFEAQRVGAHGSEAMQMDIRSTHNIPKTFENAVLSELQAMGYRIAGPGKRLNIRIDEFFAGPRAIGAGFRIETIAEGKLTAQVFDQYGRLMIERRLTARTKAVASSYTSETVSKTLGIVMSDLVKQVVTDADIRRALFY